MKLRSVLRLAACLAAAGALAACGKSLWPDRDPATVNDPAVDSVVFFPRGVRYAKTGDTLRTEIKGLQRGYVCATVTQLTWVLRDNAEAGNFLTLRSAVRLPANASCALDAGLDTVLEPAPQTPAGTKLFLQTSDGRVTDSLLFVSGQASVEALTFALRPAGDSTDTVIASGRFALYDSTAGHPIRAVYSDSMATCEVIQAATYTRSGSALDVRLRRLQADPLSAALFPPCAGPHADTVIAVPTRYGFP